MRTIKRTLLVILLAGVAWLLTITAWLQPASANDAASSVYKLAPPSAAHQPAQTQPSAQPPIVTSVTGLNEVTGAIFNKDTGQLILVGRHDPARPPLNLDDLAVALRVIYQGEAPAVSIDPNPNDNSIMQVLYFGGVENTHLGWVIFEADRLLKIYSLGRDNLTNQQIVSNVSGYKSVLERTQPGQSSANDPVWYRMWFEPLDDDQNKVKRSDDNWAILFDSAHLTVKTEYIPSEDNKNLPPGSDPAAEEFVKHFNEHFAEFAQERPVLYDLVNIQRFLIIARWLRDADIPINLSWITDYPATHTETPQTTPRIGVSQVITPYIFFLEGGVDLTKENSYLDNYPDANALQTAGLPFWGSEQLFLHSVPFSGPGGDFVTAFPIYQDYSLLFTETNSAKLIFHATRRRLISFEGKEPPLVVNFEYDAQGRVKTLTFGPNHVILLEHNAQGQLSKFELKPSTSLDEASAEIRALLDGLLTALADKPLSAPSSWRQVFDILLGKSTDQASLGTPMPVLLDQLVVQFMALSLPGYTPFFVFEENGQVVIQRGVTQLPINGITLIDFYNRLAEGQGLPESLLAFLANQPKSIFISGTSAPEQPVNMRQLIYLLGQLVHKQGAPFVFLDDDPQIAFANLNSRRPLMDQNDSWNLSFIVDEASFSASQQEKVTQIRSLATQAGIPVCTDWAVPACQGSNVIFLTARPGSELTPPPSATSGASLALAAVNGQLQGRYLALLAVDQAEERRYVRQFVVNHGAIGVLFYDGAISLDTLHTVLEKFIVLAQANGKSGLLDLTFIEAISNALGASDVTAAQLDQLQQLLHMFSYISLQRPSKQNPINAF